MIKDKGLEFGDTIFSTQASLRCISILFPNVEREDISRLHISVLQNTQNASIFYSPQIIFTNSDGLRSMVKTDRRSKPSWQGKRVAIDKVDNS